MNQKKFNRYILTHSASENLDYVRNNLRSEELPKLIYGTFVSDNYRLLQRSSLIAVKYLKRNPKFFEKYWSKVIADKNRIQTQNAYTRNMVRLMEESELPASIHGQVYDLLIGFLENPTQPIAVRAFSIAVLYNLTNVYKDLKSELLEILYLVKAEPNLSSGMKSRMRKYLPKLEKEMNLY